MSKALSRTPHCACRSGRISTLVLAVLLAGLGVPVYLLGARPLSPESHTARAIVRMPIGLTTEAEARTTILNHAAKGGAASRNVVIRLVPGKDSAASSAEVRVDYVCGSDPAEGVARADLLAERFAESLRQRQGDQAAEAYANAKQSTRLASQRLDAAQSRLQNFLRDAFARDKKPAASKVAPSKVNPEWTAVRRQLDHARHYRAGLLVDRTPLHPMVQAADDDIEDLEKRLAAIPHELVPEQGNLAEELNQMVEPPTEMPGLTGPASKYVDQLDQPLGPFTPSTAPPAPAMARSGAQPGPAGAAASRNREETLHAIQRQVDVTRKDYQEAVARQDEAGEHRFHPAAIEVVPAQLIAGSSASGPSSSGLLTVALLVAVAASAGIAMVAEGFSGKAVYANAGQARAALPVPVLAVVPAADPASRKGRQRRLVTSAIQVVCGLFLLAVSAGVFLGVSRIATLF